MEYVSPSEVINGDGLRIVLVQGLPSPWGQAAKAMMEYKGLSYTAAPWEGGGANEEMVAWTGKNNGAPIVAWNDEAPIHRWDDILLLLERLAPEKPLIPDSRRDRMRVLGLCYEICGQLGLAWNRRLSMFTPMVASGQAPEGFVLMAKKYDSREEDVVRADERQIATLKVLAGILKAQESAGSDFFIGNSVTAVDFYWASFSNLFDLLSPEKCPMLEQARPMFTSIVDSVRSAVDPILIEHRDRIMAAHFKLPMEM